MLPALAELTGRHRTTVARWYQRRRLPAAVRCLVELAFGGRLERIHAAWAGWILDPKTGELETPGGQRFTVGELLAVPYRYQELSELRAQLRELAVMARNRALQPADVRAHRAPGAGERREPGDDRHDHGHNDRVHVRSYRRRRLRLALTSFPPLVSR